MSTESISPGVTSRLTVSGSLFTLIVMLVLSYPGQDGHEKEESM